MAPPSSSPGYDRHPGHVYIISNEAKNNPESDRITTTNEQAESKSFVDNHKTFSQDESRAPSRCFHEEEVAPDQEAHGHALKGSWNHIKEKQNEIRLPAYENIFRTNEETANDECSLNKKGASTDDDTRHGMQFPMIDKEYIEITETQGPKKAHSLKLTRKIVGVQSIPHSSSVSNHAPPVSRTPGDIGGKCESGCQEDTFEGKYLDGVLQAHPDIERDYRAVKEIPMPEEKTQAVPPPYPDAERLPSESEVSATDKTLTKEVHSTRSRSSSLTVKPCAGNPRLYFSTSLNYTIQDNQLDSTPSDEPVVGEIPEKVAAEVMRCDWLLSCQSNSDEWQHSELAATIARLELSTDVPLEGGNAPNSSLCGRPNLALNIQSKPAGCDDSGELPALGKESFSSIPVPKAVEFGISSYRLEKATRIDDTWLDEAAWKSQESQAVNLDIGENIGENNSSRKHPSQKFDFIISFLECSPRLKSTLSVYKDGIEKGAYYHVILQGISKSQMRSRFESLQSHHSWSNMKDVARLVEFHAVIRGEKGLSLRRKYSNDVGGSRDDQDIFVHEAKFEEFPQFVEVTQPPGIISDVATDPPGQQSVYIPPGDHRREGYRLSTFECFPKSTPVLSTELAKNGFFYTGFYDRVKCYSCGRTVEKWAVGDNPSNKRWHKEDCLFARGVEHDNIPIGGLFSSALFNVSSSGASSQRQVGVGSNNVQNQNGPVTRSVDVTDLTRSGGTYQMQPNSTFVIGPTSVQTRQAPPPTQPPVSTASTTNPPVRRGWRMANVISADHKRHLTNLYLNREIDRLASFGRWPTGRPNVAPVALARAGFFYLGDMDRTQCFSCGGVLRNWSADDDAIAEHRTHFPNCRFVVGVERRNVPIPDQAETPVELAESYPLRFPMNPHMRSEASRLDTFDRRWPMNRTRAQPQEIAEAGFFFLGERDRVKCWYCNGGLQNWEYEDIPWIEHAKWFPNCQFLLAKQGQLFVYRYLSLSPHLPRPIIGRQDGATVDPATATVHGASTTSSRQSGSQSNSQDVAPSQARAGAPTPPPTIIDPQEELRKRRERVDKEMREGEIVKTVLAMGYEENLVRRTLADKLESGRPHNENDIFEGAAVLLDAVMEKEKELEREKEEQATSIKLLENQAASMSFPTLSSNFSIMTAGSSMNTSFSGRPSGTYQVSGFDDDDDEEIDLYSSIAEGASNVAGLVGGATNGPVSAGSEPALRQTWKDIPQDPESMKEFIEQKKEERLCKICFVETANMAFIPCGHMCCCKSCTEAIRHCPLCRKKIEKAIVTYVK